MENKLSVLDKKMPLRAIPEKTLDEILHTKFMYWLSNLLSLKADSEEKVIHALPAIKKHFWSLGMNEVKKAFTMYADGELSIKPISNYFDRVLVGQIFNEYRQLRPRKKKELKMPELTEEQKELLIYEGCLNCYEEWKQSKEILIGYTWVHDHIQHLFTFTDDEKKAMWALSKKRMIEQSKEKDYETAKDILRKLENPKDMARINEYKRIRLEYYFSSIKHIKNVL